MAQGKTTHAARRGLARLAFRLPIWLYQHHLGWLMGERLLLLTHTGRKSGLPRYAVLEVVRYDQASDSYIIASGYGSEADWLRNIQHNPNVQVQCGARQLKTVAEQLPLVVAADELHRYAQRNPRTFRALTKRLLGRNIDGSAEACRRLAADVAVVALRPHA